MISKANILRAMLRNEDEQSGPEKPFRPFQSRESNRRSFQLVRPNSQEQFVKRSKLSFQVPAPQQTEQQEKFVIRQFWRNLLRWQGFDDYMFLRDPKQLRCIGSRGSLTKNEIVEPTIVNHQYTGQVSKQYNAADGIQEYKDQHRRSQAEQIKKLYQPGEANYTKFNASAYKKSFQGKSDQLEFTEKTIQMLEKARKILHLMDERMIVEEVASIGPLGERLLRLMWKVGCLNLFMMASYIHNSILSVYGKERVAYANWKKTLRICNMQGNANHKFKLVAYKHISKICIKLQLYEKSLVYLKKMLKLSWIVNDTNYELFTYDKISLCYYYKQDMDKAIFYHEKFAQGEFEPLESGMRMVGEQAYLLGAKLKEGLLDQQSYSEDDFDLDALLQKGNLNKWETENRRKELRSMIKKLPVEYKKGHSFGKITRPVSEQVVDFKQSMQILSRFQSKYQTPLGPVFQKAEETEGQRLRKKNEQAKSCQYLFNQKSTNRVAQNFLLQEEIKDQPQGDIFCFKPSENVFFIKKMIKVFQYDLKYYGTKQCLFANSTDALL